MAPLKIERLHPDFGARLSGVDLRSTLPPATLEEIRVAIDTYSFLHFPRQQFDDDHQLAFTKSLGEPEVNHVVLGQEGRIEYFLTIGNVQADGSQLGNSHKKTKFLTGNNVWHTDSSFRDLPSLVSIMCAYEVPDEGGDTEFVSTRAAYRRLPDDLKATIEPLIAIHDYVFSRSKVGPDAVTPPHAASLPPVRQKLVRANPRSGAKNYYVGSHAREIDGWNETDGRALLDDLLRPRDAAEACAHPQVATGRSGHFGTTAACCIAAKATTPTNYRRLMRQTRVCGVGSTLTHETSWPD